MCFRQDFKSLWGAQVLELFQKTTNPCLFTWCRLEVNPFTSQIEGSSDSSLICIQTMGDKQKELIVKEETKRIQDTGFIVIEETLMFQDKILQIFGTKTK